MTSARNNSLVMCAAIGYDEKQIVPFLASLRKAGYSGDVLMIVTPEVARRVGRMSLFRGVTLSLAPQWFPYRWNLLDRRWARKVLWAPQRILLWGLLRTLGYLPFTGWVRIKLLSMVAMRLYPPSEVRYLYYLRFLRKHPYSRVLLSDVRDVVFQTDPFLSLPPKGLTVSMEAKHHSIGSERHNASWIRWAYGAAALEKLADKPVSCSGVTYGDGQSVCRYLELIAEEIFKLKYPAAAITRGGFDQGIHNFLLWTGRLGKPYMMETLESPIATLGGVRECELSIDGRGRVLNRDGSVISILHQYDRLPEKKTALIDILNR